MVKKNQIIYIVSSPYSGSTWISFVLGSHPEVATLGEHWRRFRGKRDSECRTCEHRGLAHCEILQGITQTPPQEAYAAPLQRFAVRGVKTLVDNSKHLDWLEELIACGACDLFSMRVIHLIRDPRGWITSVTGRNPQISVAALLSQWKQKTIEQKARLAMLDLPTLRISYDMACLDSERVLEKLSAFVGVRYDLENLRYWEREHHAMAGNGAAINVLSNGKGFTWDREYYTTRLGKVFYDDRWKRRMDSNQLSVVAGDFEAAGLMQDFDTSFEIIDALAQARALLDE